MFIDEAKIFVKGGDGGAGAVSFRREKHVPRGGADGGNGGFGGNIIFLVDEGLKTLQDFKYKRHFKAKRGAHGQGKMKNGANGTDLILRLPPGTLIKDEEGNILADLTQKDEHYVAAEGGHGGKGNAYYESARRRAPSFAQKGELGESKWLNLELKLLADVGIVGMPNAGKSTFISVVSAAKPKIADYPFTTLVPNLGVVKTDHFSYVIADIPGLIEGAHKGAGLGDTFLRHVDRAALIVHMIDLNTEDPVKDYKIIRDELFKYSNELDKRERFIVGNKIDIVQDEDKLKSLEKYFKDQGISFYKISAATKKGIEPLMHSLTQKVKDLQEKTLEEEPKEEEAFTYKLEHKKLSDYKIAQLSDGVFKVMGRGIERFVMMSDLENIEAVNYMRQKFKAISLERRLKHAGAKEGDLIKIREYEFEFRPSIDEENK